MNSFGTVAQEKSICAMNVWRARSCRVPGEYSKLLKAHRRLVRGLANSLRPHVLNNDVDLVGGWVREERFEHAALLVLGDRGVSQGRLEEEQESGYSRCTVARSRPKCFTMNCVRSTPHLRRLRLVAGRIALNRFRASDIVDSDDQRLDLGAFRGRVEVEAEQSQRNQGDEDERDLE
jgi:hypothetical protein